MDEEILALKMKGYCCSQIIMMLGLSRMGKENDDLVKAMVGLCNGIWAEKLCGTLSAAVCLLCLEDEEAAKKAHIRDLTEWFEEAFGSLDCDVLMDGNQQNKVERCPLIVERTFEKIEELLDW